MRKWIIFLVLFIVISGCGDTAPKDAIVTGPGDESFSLPASAAGAIRIFRPMIFTVKDAKGRLIPDVELEIIANNGNLVDINNIIIALNPPPNDILVTRTDDEGAVTLAIRVTLPLCVVGEGPATLTSSVSVSTGFTNALARQTWTVGCP